MQFEIDQLIITSTYHHHPTTYLSVPGRLRNLVQQHVAPQLPVLVRDGVVQRVSPDVPEEPVQADLARRRPGSRHLKHASRHAQAGVGRDHLDAGDPFGPVAALPRGEAGPVVLILSKDAVGLVSGPVGERLGCAEVSKEVAVGLEYVELVGCFFLVLFVGAAR